MFLQPLRALFRIRGRLLGARPLPPHVPRGLVDRLTSIGWVTLAHEPGRQRVFGAVTRPWEANVRFTPVAPEAFAESVSGSSQVTFPVWMSMARRKVSCLSPGGRRCEPPR